MKTPTTAQLNSAEQALLALVGKSLFGKSCELSEEEQTAALSEADKQAVLSVAALGCSHAAVAAWQGRVLRYITNNARIHGNHTLVHEMMGEAGIPYTILKGAASASYYPKPLYREMGDVDFLVLPQDIPKATRVLQEHGFEPWTEKHICHIVFRKDAVRLEMHFEPAGIPNEKPGETVRRLLEDAISSSTLYQSDTDCFMNPSPFTHGLVMLLHMQHHLLVEGIGLRHLCDWAVFVNGFSEREFRNLFEEKLKKAGLWDFACALSMAAHRGIGLAYRDFMGQNIRLGDDLLRDILRGGNFGRKDKERQNQGMFISNRGKDGVRKNRIVQFFGSVNQIVYTQWPICHKVKILLVFGWMYFGVRRGIRVLLGRRKPLHLVRAYRQSRDRKNLYRQFHLFEIQK